MPTFLYTIIVFSVLAWFYWYKLLIQTAPESTKNVFWFLFISFIALTLTLSVPTYFMSHRKSPDFTNLRVIYRKALRVSMFLSLIIVGLMGLKAFGALTLINGALFVLLGLIVFPQLKK